MATVLLSFIIAHDSVSSDSRGVSRVWLGSSAPGPCSTSGCSASSSSALTPCPFPTRSGFPQPPGSDVAAPDSLPLSGACFALISASSQRACLCGNAARGWRASVSFSHARCRLSGSRQRWKQKWWPEVVLGRFQCGAWKTTLLPGTRCRVLSHEPQMFGKTGEGPPSSETLTVTGSRSKQSLLSAMGIYKLSNKTEEIQETTMTDPLETTISLPLQCLACSIPGLVSVAGTGNIFFVKERVSGEKHLCPPTVLGGVSGWFSV
ncbi:uncharacterized protein LOC135278570 [Passer domesticus]|uniref:uncharacterized protein LOC135278570 n=1 Tax=Passer domesticus TaxID=48849 RepID=UPI0030FE9E4B